MLTAGYRLKCYLTITSYMFLLRYNHFYSREIHYNLKAALQRLYSTGMNMIQTLFNLKC